MTPEPKGKLDTMATKQAAMSAAVAVVNGPEDEPLDWHAVDWRAVEADVRRLRRGSCTGLLDPDARKACKCGSQGGRAHAIAPHTRQGAVTAHVFLITDCATGFGRDVAE